MVERPRGIEGSAPEGFEDYLRIVEELDVPGHKAEIIRGKIVVSPWSRFRTLPPMRILRRALEDHAPGGHIADTTPILFAFPHARRAYGPDVYVVDEAAALQSPGVHVDGATLSLVAELTSVSTRDVDWEEKVSVGPSGARLPAAGHAGQGDYGLLGAIGEGLPGAPDGPVREAAVDSRALRLRPGHLRPRIGRGRELSTVPALAC
jgi:hypothetical protein